MTCPLCGVGPNHPNYIATLEHGVVILSDNQGCPGWCTLILKRHMEHLDQLPIHEQAALFAEVGLVARAIRQRFPTHGAGGGPVRINYECLGNIAAHVHWHIIPRHANDLTPRATVWGWPATSLTGNLGPVQREELIADLRATLQGE